jgi:hypothetical protein
MKKFYQLLASASLLLLVTGASAQNNGNTIKPNNNICTVKGGNIHKTHQTKSTQSYAFLDYPFSDSLAVGPNYNSSPLLGQYYIQQMNAHFVAKDTGTKATNTLLLHSCSVSFDTMLDASTGTGTPLSAVTSLNVDSLFIPIGWSNASGKNDTLLIQITNLGAAGAPGSTVLWSTKLINDTGLSGKNKSWLYGYTIVLAPNLSISAGNTFGVTMTFYDESKKDTFGFLYGSPTYTCTSPAMPLPDTTKIGMNIVAKLPANSFTNGYSYYTAANHKGASVELPSVAYGGDAGFGYSCTAPTANTSAMPFQDIALFAEVTLNPVITSVSELANNGFDVAQNAPNPFNKNSQISYTLSKESDVMFSVYDLTGRKLVENNYSNMATGQHVINLSANQFTPGIYFYSVKVNGNVVTKRMVITQ